MCSRAQAEKHCRGNILHNVSATISFLVFNRKQVNNLWMLRFFSFSITKKTFAKALLNIGCAFLGA